MSPFRITSSWISVLFLGVVFVNTTAGDTNETASPPAHIGQQPSAGHVPQAWSLQPGGLHVCTKVISTTTKTTAPKVFSKKKTYYTVCPWIRWNRCKRHTVTYVTRLVPTIQRTTQQIYECCVGWAQTGNECRERMKNIPPHLEVTNKTNGPKLPTVHPKATTKNSKITSPPNAGNNHGFTHTHSVSDETKVGTVKTEPVESSKEKQKKESGSKNWLIIVSCLGGLVTVVLVVLVLLAQKVRKSTKRVRFATDRESLIRSPSVCSDHDSRSP